MYDWLEAGEIYGKALSRVSARAQDLLKGEIYERLGYVIHRAAMQSKSAEEFGDRMHQAISHYEKAKECFEGSNESSRTPRKLRCQAMVAYLKYWLTTKTAEKKKLASDCWTLAKEAMKTFEETGEPLEYGKTFNQLLNSALFGFLLELDFKTREKLMREAMEHGEHAMALLSASEEPHDREIVHAKTIICTGLFAYNFLDLEGRDNYYRKYIGDWKAKKSEETSALELLFPAFGPNIFWGLEGTDEALANLKKALEFANKTKDRYMIGCALDWLAYHTAWKSMVAEDPDEALSLLKTAFQHCEEAKRHFHQISFTSPRGDFFWIEGDACEYHAKLATLETDAEKKRHMMAQALEDAPKMLKKAEDSGYLEILGHAHHQFSIVLATLAQMVREPLEEKRLLDEALVHRNNNIKITEQITPLMYWNLGVIYGARANLKSELAEFAESLAAKNATLQEAVLDMEKAVEFSYKDLAFYQSKGSAAGLLVVVAKGHTQYGYLLSRLHESTGDKECIRKALMAFDEAIKIFKNLNLNVRIAECQWKVAQVYDDLGEHLNAAENFDLASDNYMSAAEKIPQLKDFYRDHGVYMQAWSEIERARHYHKRQEYSLAEERFKKAATMHKSSRQWSYLAPNYTAWGLVEHAEKLSRKEQSEEALQAFKQAVRLFEETRKSIQTRLDKIENPDEKQMADNMIKASRLRREYCTARITLEEARILDKKGDHFSSSEKYGSAAEAFEKITQSVETEQDRKEFRFISILSRAWQKMTRAEAEASPTLYAEASRLFEETKNVSPNERVKMLTLGHSRFCKALEAGTKFVDTRNVNVHAEVLSNLESASNYYLKADFQKASEYAKATRLLFDAYLQLDDAKKERDPEKKARLYAMTEKILQTSAGSFMKAEHPEKREEVLKLMEEVKEEQELAISLTEVLHAPSIVSSTTAFPTPMPMSEEAVGLDQFEHADVRANIVISETELRIDENLDLEIELVNAGKGHALLTKITNVIPKGFELKEKPQICRVEGSYINLKGKRLDPLRTEEIRLVLKPKAQGKFPLRPRILYLDENGNYKVHEPEPITITVKELGIRGWLKG